MDLSIIIVNYNTEELTVQTLNSIYSQEHDFTYEVIVVDNASVDNSVSMIKERFPRLKLIKNKRNLGFAAANNKGIKQSCGKYILLLNSDTIVLEDTLKIMLDFMMDNERVGAAGCKVVLPDGSLDKACKRSFPTPHNALYKILGLDKLFPDSKRFGAYNLTYLDEDRVHEVDCLVGAFMLLCREVIEEVGLLDEDYFLYGEDIDWCYRIKNAGWKIIYYPEVKIIHYKGGSNPGRSNRVLYHFYRSMYLFYKKHYQDKYSIVTKGIVFSGIFSIFFIAVLKNLFRFPFVSEKPENIKDPDSDNF